MYSALRHRIIIEEKKEEAGPFGVDVKWVPVAERWGGFAEVNLEGRAQYQQIGHSSVTGKLIFEGPLGFELGMAKHRFKIRGECFEAVEPPSNPDTVNRFVSIVVRRLPQQP